jgi:DNA-binding beta-propeller fold protein YncE
MAWHLDAGGESRRRAAYAAGALLAALCAGGCRSREADARSRASGTTVEGAVPTRTCAATANSLTPSSWQAARHPAPADAGTPVPGLRIVADIPLPGPPNRFDYQSLDPASGRLWISHMNAGRVILFDVDSQRVIAEIPDLPRVTGVWAVPTQHQVYASAAGAHEVAVIDDRTLRVVARIGGARFPDGIAYVPEVGSRAGKAFVSDESGEADLVIDAATLATRSLIPLGGEAGNTHYDSVSGCVLVAVQTRGQLVAIDPASERVVARYDVPGVEGPHGFALDERRRLAFVTGEGNAALAVVDLRTMRVTQRVTVGTEPDVLAWDPGWRRLYVASESGVLSTFWVTGDTLLPLGDARIPHAHTVAVDPRTHRVYLPLEDVGGRPVLRVLEPMRPAATRAPG